MRWGDRVAAYRGSWRGYVRALCSREFVAWLWHRVWLDDVPTRAAALSYYFLLALFPLLIFLFALTGYLFASQGDLRHQLLRRLGAMMPREAYITVRDALDELMRTRGGGKLSLGLGVALWLASSGMEATIEGLNIVCQVDEVRPWWRRRLVAIGLTVLLALSSAFALGAILAGGWIGTRLADLAGMAGAWAPLWSAMQRPVSLAFLLFSISVVYRFGPNLKSRRKDQIVLPGAMAALLSWMAASAAMQFYFDELVSYGNAYGSLGAVIALLVWLYITAFTLLFGAEINSGIQLLSRSAEVPPADE